MEGIKDDCTLSEYFGYQVWIGKILWMIEKGERNDNLKYGVDLIGRCNYLCWTQKELLTSGVLKEI